MYNMVVACYMFYLQHDRIEEYITNKYRNVENEEPVVRVPLSKHVQIHYELPQAHQDDVLQEPLNVIIDIPVDENLLDYGIHQEDELLLVEDYSVNSSASLCPASPPDDCWKYTIRYCL